MLLRADIQIQILLSFWYIKKNLFDSRRKTKTKSEEQKKYKYKSEDLFISWC